MALRAPSLLGLFSLTMLLAGCAQPPESGPVQVSVLSTDGVPLPGALAAIEAGGLFVGGYAFGAQAGFEPADPATGTVAGSFTTVLPAGRHGIHTFAEGYKVTSVEVVVEPDPDEFQSFEIRAAAMAEDAARPTTQNLTLSPTSAAPGDLVSLSVDVVGAADDPISAQVLMIDPIAGTSAAFNPPPPPNEDEAPGPADGTWSLDLTAPPAPGTYPYYVVASSTAGMTAPILSTTLLVE